MAHKIFDPSALRGRFIRIGSPEIPGGRSSHYALCSRGVFRAVKIGKMTFIDGTTVANAFEHGEDAVIKIPSRDLRDRHPTGRPVGRPKKVRPEATTTDSAASES